MVTGGKYHYKEYNQDQQLLLPISIEEWVEEDSLARFISDVVDLLEATSDLEVFHRSPGTDGGGRPSYHPVMMLKVLLFAYATGIQSSRKIAKKLEQNVAFRYLAANQQPDFRTISDFRKDHRDEFHRLFTHVTELCLEAGLGQLDDVAGDGQKVKGDAALDQNYTREKIDAKIEEILEEAAAVDEAEDELYGPETRGDELPEELRVADERVDRLMAAKERLDERERAKQEEQAEKLRQREQEEEETGKKKPGPKPTPPEEVELDEDTKANATDPDSQTLKTRTGWLQGFNAQAWVDCEDQLILAMDVTNDANDVHQLAPLLDQFRAQHGRKPRNGIFDAGYCSEDNFALQDEDIELYIATTKDWKRREKLAEQGPPRGRIPKDITPTERMERKLRTKRGKAQYRKRGQTVEPVFGQHVNRGLDRFLLRGLRGAKAEWSLFSATHNLLKLWRSGWSPDSGNTGGGPAGSPRSAVG